MSTLPDIYINSGEITYAPVNPTPDGLLIITFIVRNLGETSLTNVLTKLYNGNPAEGGTAVNSYTIQSLPGKGVYGVMAAINSPNPGVNTYYLMADADNTVVESNESNNFGGVTVLVGVSEDEDLVIFPNNISFTRQPGAQPGDPIAINAVVSNTGSTTVTIDVDFYNGDPSAGGILIGRRAVTVPAIGNAFIGVPWTLPEENTAVYVVVDPDSRIPETNEANNIAYRYLAPTLPDLRLTDADITYSPRYPTPKSKITITTTLRNFGEADAIVPQVFLYEGAPESGGTYIPSATMLDPGVIQPLSYATATMVHSFSAGVHEFYVIADPNNTIEEIHENNNRAKIEITIGNDPKTDLFISADDIVFSPALPLTGQQVTITATIHNSGSEYTAHFPVAIYNGDPANGGTLINKTNIWAPQEGINKVTAAFTMPSGVPEIFVVADEGNTLTETSESNNAASKTIDTYRVDLSVSAGDISLKPVMPAAGDIEDVEVAVHSRGITNTSATLNLYEGTPETGRLIGTQGFSIIDGQTVKLIFPSYTYPGDGAVLTAVIEDASPAEDDLSNNIAIAVFGEHIEDGSSNEGTDFWVAFPDVYYDTARIVVQSRHIANVTVKAPSFTWQGEISPGFPAIIPINAPTIFILDKIRSDSVVEDRGIHITSDRDVSVVFHTPNVPGIADDSYLSIPTNMLGTEYYILSYRALIRPAFFVVIATEDNTNVSMNGTIVNMNKGQTYQGKKSTLEHSGTYILSDKPVAVIAGTECSNVPITIRWCDSLLEEMLPVSILGTDHYTAPLYSPGSADVFRILAAHDSTQITVKDKYYTKNYTLNAGQWIEYEDEYATHVTSTAPIMLAQFAKGKEAAQFGDPFQMTIIPTDKLKKEYRFFIHEGYEEGDFFTVVAPEPETSVMLDGIPLTSGWSPLPDKGTYLLMPVNIGEHVITADKPVAVYAHGYRLWGSYGYPAGIALPASNLAVSNLAITPQSPSEGQLVEITANLINDGDKWAKDAVVRLYNGDPLNGGVQIGEDFNLDIIYPTESVTIRFQWEPFGYIGTNNIYIVADPLDTIRESSEDDNTVMAIVNVPAVPVKSDPSVTVSDITISRQVVYQGDMVTLFAKIKNRGADVGNIPVSLYLGDPRNGGMLLGSRTIEPILPLNSEQTVAFTFTVGFTESADLYVVIDPNNVIDELIEENNVGAKFLLLNPSSHRMEVETDKVKYQSNSDVGIKVLLENESMFSWTGIGEVYIKDIYGNLVSHIASFSIDDLNPNGISEWAYRVPVNITAELDMKDKIERIDMDFALILEDIGMPDRTLDQNSIRVLEFDFKGDFISEKQINVEFSSATITNIAWLMDGLTAEGTTRYFYIYFDITENGIKVPFQNTDFTDTYDLIAFSDDIGKIYLIESKGEGTFGAPILIDDVSTASDYSRGIVLDDFNNDRFIDIITGSGANGEIYYYRNRADGSDTFEPKITVGTITTSCCVMDIARGDFNNDGNKDFVVSGNANNLLYLFSGNGDGTFTQSNISAPSGTNLFRGKAAVDINGDEKLDLVVSNSYGMIYLYKGNGDGTFISPVQIVNIGGDAYGIAAGDFDEDGKIDIIANNGSTGDAYLIKGNGNGTFGTSSLIPSLDTNNYTAFDTGDFNNDEKLDVIAATYTNKTIDFYPGNGDGTFGPRTAITTTSYYNLGISSSPALPEVSPVLGVPETMPSMSFNFIWKTGDTPPGSYRVHVTLSEGEGVIAEDYTSFEILPDIKVDSTVVLDKVSYNPNEAVTITSTVTSLSENAYLENLTADVTIKNGQGIALFTDSNNIPLLTPGGTTEFNTYWNTLTNPPGDYPVTLEVKDASGNILSSSATNLTIESTFDPKKLLTGQISVDRQSILQGEPVNITYGISNVGNMDLAAIDISVPIVHVVELTPYDTLTDQTSLLMGGTYTNTQELDTHNYTAKDYLVILRANISGIEATLASTYFRVEGAPSAPSLNSPVQDEDIETLTPSLIVNNAADPNDDELTYQFELYSDSGLANLLASSDMIAEGENTTSWSVPFNLTENSRYYWRARAYDGLLYGEWMTPASFRVNLTNEPPTAPTLSSPDDNSSVDTLTPLLVVNNAYDPDSENLTYNFELSLDSEFTQILASEIGIFEGEGITSWQTPISLTENTYYYWRAQADDWLTEGPWMIPAGFFVNTANDAPTAPVIIAPADNSEISSFSTDIVVTNSTDPDSENLTYIFEIDTVNTFDSPDLMYSSNIPEGIVTTSWHVDSLIDNTYYYVRAKASDGLAESAWSEVIRFFVNILNDAPSIPTLANPSDGSGVNTFTPVLSIHNSTDIDGDTLTYEFELYQNEAMLNLIASSSAIAETPQVTSWTVSVNLTENRTYYWRARAFDGELYSGWMIPASFMVNTANDAPSAPTLHSPAQGSSLDTLNPTLSVYNAADPDSDILTYDIEIYSNGALIQSITGVPQNLSGITSTALTTALTDNTTYNWRARAYDGDRYGAWMDMASFSIHLPVTNITATIDFDPNTLNQKSQGKWVVVYIELPQGYNVSDIEIPSVRLEGTIPAEPWPYNIGDYDKDRIPDLMVKFNRAAVINLLPAGEDVIVHVTGSMGAIGFEGFDIIRVIH